MLLRIAFRNLARNRRRTGLTLAAVAIGVMAVVGVRGFLNGLQRMIVASVAEGQTGAIQLHARGFMQSMEAAPLTPNLVVDDALLKTIAAVDGVSAVAPRIMTGGMVNVGDETVFALVQAVDPVRELQALPRRADLVVQGAWLDPTRPTMLTSAEIGRAVQAKPGDKAAVLTNDVDGVMNAVEAPLGGQLVASVQGEKRLLVMPLPLGQELLRMEGRATEIAVGVRDLDDVEAVAARLRAALPATIEVHTWRDVARFADDAVRTQDAALGVVTSIFLFVILLGVANTLLMSVMERVREIGTLMAIGAKRKQVLRLFVFEAFVLGAFGGALGAVAGAVIVGLLGARGVRLTTPGASVPQLVVPYSTPGFLLYVLVLCAFGAALAALYPAWKASRLRPVEALARA